MGKETAEFHAVAEQEGISPVKLRDILDKAKAAHDETTKRDNTARATEPSRPVAAAPAAAPSASGLAWPSEKWKSSTEELSRKRFAIITFLRRVWKPFIEDNKVLVTRKVLKERDAEAELALKGYLRAHDMPSDIRILSDKALKQCILTERPVLIRQPQQNSVSANI